MRPLIRQAIQTTYRGATNTKPSSIRAVAEARSITVSWDHALDQADNHRAAAEQLAARLGWSGRLIGGGLRGASYAWVFMPEDDRMLEALRKAETILAADRQRRAAKGLDDTVGASVLALVSATIAEAEGAR